MRVTASKNVPAWPVPPGAVPDPGDPRLADPRLIPPARLFARVRGDIPGPRSQALRAAEAEHLAPGTQTVSQLSGLAFLAGQGALLTDVDGNTFIDWVAGIGVASIGHGHPALARALADQAARLSCGSFTTESRVELLARIAQLSPDPALHRTQLYSGGAEAVESALRLARAHTGHFEVLSFWGGFHGKTAGVLGLLGSEFKQGLGPLPPGQILAPYPECARCPFKLRRESCGLHCVDFTRQVLRLQSSGSLAAILVEPIQGTAGNISPPDGWLPAMRDLAHEHGALLILDEMICGFGRTGRMWGGQHFGVTGDIITFGKGVAAGFPVTGLISTDRIVAADPWSRPSFSSSSFGGSPLAAAAAAAVTRVIAEDRLDLHAAQVGQTLLSALLPLSDKYPFVGEVRGKGLLIGLDLWADRARGVPLSAPDCAWIFRRCLAYGLLTMAYAPRVRINPPLVITAAQALEGVAILDQVLSEFADRHPGVGARAE